MNLYTSNLEPLKPPEVSSWTSSLALYQTLILSRCKSLPLKSPELCQVRSADAHALSLHTNLTCIIICETFC